MPGRQQVLPESQVSLLSYPSLLFYLSQAGPAERGLPPGFSGEWMSPLRTTIADSRYSQRLCSTKFPGTLDLPILLPGELQGQVPMSLQSHHFHQLIHILLCLMSFCLKPSYLIHTFNTLARNSQPGAL